MRIAIKDANIIIDLYEIDLLDKTLQLDIEFYVTRFVLKELNIFQKKAVENSIAKKLIVLQDFSFEETMQIAELKQHHKAFSFPDCSVLYFADKIEAMILTGERKLRHVAGLKTIEVHGIIWVFDELLKNSLLSPQEAIDKMEYLLDINKRMPLKICQGRIQKWQSNL